MNRMKKMLIWVAMMNKRLYKKVSFLVIIALIPVLTLSMTLMAEEESGIITIAVCAEDEGDFLSSEIIENLLEDPGVILFKADLSEEEAKEAVENGDVDAVWIFHQDIEEKIKDLREPFVTVLEREESVSLQLSHEKLYDVLYPHMSYHVYHNFIEAQFPEADMSDEETLRELYDEASEGETLIEYERLDMGKVELGEAEYLTTPLRGLLAVVIILCGLAAVMYYYRDKEKGTYDWLSEDKKLIPAYGLAFVAVVNACVAVLLALVISGLSEFLIGEILSMVVFVFATVMFSVFVGILCNKAALIGQVTPFVMLITLIVSPIFFSFSNLKTLQMLLPTYYYIYGVNDGVYLVYGLIYSVVLFFLSGLLNKIKRVC